MSREVGLKESWTFSLLQFLLGGGDIGESIKQKSKEKWAMTDMVF